eukprot:1053723-Rhodomonas_salina.1
MPGTDLGYAATRHFAKSGTDEGDAATKHYAKFGTDLGYADTGHDAKSGTLTEGMRLPRTTRSPVLT